jgi:hypothetical protein
MMFSPTFALEPDSQTPAAARRTVIDASTGHAWQVWEVDTTHMPGARGPRCLIFDGREVIRRVWSVPDDWRGMTDEGLLRLMTGR